MTKEEVKKMKETIVRYRHGSANVKPDFPKRWEECYLFIKF